MAEQQEASFSQVRKQLLNFIGLVILISLLLILIFPGKLFHDIIDARIISALEKSQPDAKVILGKTSYNLWQNSFKVEIFEYGVPHKIHIRLHQLSVRRVKWLKMIIRGKPVSKDILTTKCEAGEIRVDLLKKGYFFICRNFRASVPDSSFSAESLVYRPIDKNEEFFKRSSYRKTIIDAEVASFRVDLAFVPEEWHQKTFHAKSISFEKAVFSLVVNKDKGFAPGKPKGIMPNEMLSRSNLKLWIDSLRIDKGKLEYSERMRPGMKPATVTFNDIRITGYRIGNLIKDTALILAKANLMDSGRMFLRMKYPLAAKKLYVLLNGSLGAMELSGLNRFIEPAQQIRITSGLHHKTEFAIKYVDKQATGILDSYYENLKVALIDSTTKKEKGSLGKVATLLANLKLRGSNMPGDAKEGKVDFERGRKDTFIRFLWISIRNGIGEIAGFGKKKKKQ